MNKRILAILLCAATVAVTLFSGMALGFADLSAPKTVASTDPVTGKPMLRWDKIAGAEQYEIFRATRKDGDFTRQYTMTSTKYTNTTAVAGRTYYYKVRAVDAEGNAGTFSSVKAIACDCARPVVTASANIKSGKPQLSWDAVTGADRYTVLRATAKNGTYYEMFTTTATRYTNASAAEGKTYYYKVVAKSDASRYADSAESAVVSAGCEDTVIALGFGTHDETGKPTLNWNALAGAQKYEIYRATEDGEFVRQYTTTSVRYTNTTAAAGTTYSYKVRAVDAEGNKGNFSNPVTVLCRCARPAVTASTSIKSGKPQLSWDAVAGAERYTVYRAATKNGTYYEMYTTAGTSYTNASAVAERTYFYKVKALGAVSDVDSAMSEPVSSECTAATLTISSGISEETGKPTLNWSRLAGAQQYEIYRATENGSFARQYMTASTAYTNTTAVAGTIYSYKVRAVDAEGNKGNFSNVVTVTCSYARPKAAIKTVSEGFPRLTWDAVAGAERYEVFRALSLNGTYTKMYTTTALYYTNTSAEVGKTYYYKVRAVGDAGNGAYSAVQSITCAMDEDAIGTAVCTASDMLNLRSGPGASYPIVGKLKAGTRVNIYDESYAWYRIRYNGSYYWASGVYLRVTLGGDTSTADRDYATFPMAKNDMLKGKVIFLDPGHGTGNGGAYAGYVEHTYNLVHAKLIRQNLENCGATVIMSRTDSTDVDDYARVAAANKYTLQVLKKNKQSEYDKLKNSGAASQTKLTELQEELDELNRLIGVMQSVIDDPDLAKTYFLSPYDEALGRGVHKDLKRIFELQKDAALRNVIYVSIHSNATADGSTSTNGTMTFYMDNEQNKAYYTGYQATRNKRLATNLCNEVVAAGGFKKCGVKVNDYFMVREVNIVSALLEIGFHTNADDREKLMDPAVEKRVANGVTYAIIDYFN